MNEEEKQTIERIKRDYELAKSEDAIDIDIFTEDIKTVLNLLEKKDKEIQFQKEINKTEQDRHKQTEKSLKGQLKKKDKMIDLMEEKIFEEGIVWENKEDVKQYYERKVENGN